MQSRFVRGDLGMNHISKHFCPETMHQVDARALYISTTSQSVLVLGPGSEEWPSTGIDEPIVIEIVPSENIIHFR